MGGPMNICVGQWRAIESKRLRTIGLCQHAGMFENRFCMHKMLK